MTKLIMILGVADDIKLIVLAPYCSLRGNNTYILPPTAGICMNYFPQNNGTEFSIPLAKIRMLLMTFKLSQVQIFRGISRGHLACQQ